MKPYWAFRWFMSWTCPLPLLVKILRTHFDSCVVYQDDTHQLEWRRRFPDESE